MPRMSTDEMLSQLQTLEKQAVGYHTGEVAAEQAKAMDYYLSKPFGNEVEGRSQVVSSDVYDVVEGLTPMVLKPFLASDDVVRFNPLGPDDEDAAQQESEYMNWIITQRNDSFSELLAWMKTGLLQKNGVVKYWWEKTTESSIERYYGVPDDIFAALAQDKGVTVVEHTETMGDDGLPVHDVVLRTSDDVGFAKFCVIPPEEFRISRDAACPDPKKARFVQHLRMATLGELRGMGYKLADEVPDGMDNDPSFSVQYQARRTAEESYTGADEGNDASMREVLFKETFWLIDADGDGIPELRKLCTVGSEILSDEETEEIPFAAWTPCAQPFKFYGRCPADEALSIQDIKSAILRETQNNLYSLNNNRTYANADVNISDLIDNQISGVVRVEGKGNVAHAVAAAEITPIGQITMPMVEYWDGAKESRTGWTRYNQGMDADSLNKTATGIRIIAENANLRVEIISRAFANGLAELMRGMHGLCRRHATKAETIRLRGKWVDIDPRAWKKRSDLSISVGLGNSDQQMRLQGIQMLMNEQKAMAQGQVGIVQPVNFYNAAAKLSEIVGFKSPDQFFTQPQQEQGLPPEVQAQMQQMQQMLQQAQQEIQALKSGVEVKQIEVQSRERIEQAKMQNALQIEEKRDDQKRDSEEIKAWLQLMLQRFEAQQAEAQASRDAADAMAAMPENEPGEKKPDAADVMTQILQSMSAPKRKKLSITAPSGQIYQGTVEDDAGDANG